MQQTFSTLPSTSRLWIYTAERTLTTEEQELMLTECRQFISQWAAHGSDLRAAAKFVENTFLVIAMDESFQMASGCSIDSAVRFVKELGSRYRVDFFDRSLLLFKDNGQIRRLKMKQLREAIEEETITPNSLFFNTNINTLGELNTNWPVKAEESWLKRYFKATESV